MSIKFNDIKSIFPENQWDVGYISETTLKQVSLMPIKAKLHPSDALDCTNKIHFEGLTNSIVLIRDGHTWDYTFYKEAMHLLDNSDIVANKEYELIYTNYKEAAIHAGLGVRARNSLIYSYKFGFDSHICVIGFYEPIIDVPTNKRVNYKLWSRCKNCNDCVRACPAGAIHGEVEPYWLDSSECDQFIGCGSHERIPSIKMFWHKHVYPEVDKKLIDKIHTAEDRKRYLNLDNWVFDRNGYTYDGHVTRKDGIPVIIPFCRECTSQPRCSKWGGNYPYDRHQDIETV